MHHRLPQQTSRGGGPEEEREEERGEGGQDREKWQQGDGRQKLAGLGEVSSAREPSVCFRKNNFVYHFSMWIHSLFLLSLLDTTEKKKIKEPNFVMYAPLSQRLKGLMDKDEQESEVIKDSPDSPEPLNKKPRLTSEEIQPPERSKGTNT